MSIQPSNFGIRGFALLFALLATGDIASAGPLTQTIANPGDLEDGLRTARSDGFGPMSNFPRPSRSLDPIFMGDETRLLYVSDLLTGVPKLQVGDAGISGNNDAVVHAGGRLRIAGADLGLGHSDPWTLSFRLRVSQSDIDAGFDLLRCEGRMGIRAGNQSRLFFESAGDAPRRRGLKASLVPGQWHHLTLVWDPLVLGSARMVMDEVSLGVSLKAQELSPSLGTAPVFLLDAEQRGLEIEDVVLLSRALSTNEIYRRTGMPLDDWESAPPLRECLPLLQARLTGRQLAAWGVTDHLAVDQGQNALSRVPAQWKQLDLQPGSQPQARTTHVSLSIGGGRIMIFGSEARDTHASGMRNLSDVWVLDVGAKRWTQLDSEGATPAPRCHQSGAYDPKSDVFFYPAGLRNDRRPAALHNDLWALQVGASKWSNVTPPGSGWPAFSDSVVFFRPENELFYFTRRHQLVSWSSGTGRLVDSRRIRALDVAGEPLEDVLPASSIISVYDPVNDHTLLFGGASFTTDGIGLWEDGMDPRWKFTNRSWLLDAEAATMRLVDSKENFSPRVRAAAGHDPRTGHTLVYGGVRDQHSQRYEDLWAFDPNTEQWTPKRQAHAPGPRGGYYGMPFDEVSKRFVLTHGRSSPTRFHEDTWLLDYNPRSSGTGRWLFDRRSFPELDQVLVRGTTGFPPGVTVHLRSGPSAAELSFRDPAGPKAFGARDAFVELSVQIEPSAGDWGLTGIEFGVSGAGDEAQPASTFRVSGEPLAGR